MKKHLCGFFIALTAFFVSFYISPIRFIAGGSGHGATADLQYDCSFSNTFSNHFSLVNRWSCDYKNPETANKIFGDEVSKFNEIIEPVEEIKLEDGKSIYRTIIKSHHGNLEIYCLIRSKGNMVDAVASPSLRHVREFEEQRFMRK